MEKQNIKTRTPDLIGENGMFQLIFKILEIFFVKIKRNVSEPNLKFKCSQERNKIYKLDLNLLLTLLLAQTFMHNLLLSFFPI